MVKISILSAVHNEAAHISEMIGSVIGQSYADWELLFVDDGSSDETAAIIERQAQGDPRIQLVAHGAKIGKTAAFSTAFAASTGEVICLAAGDDTLPPHSLATRVGLFDEAKRAGRVAAYGKLRTFSSAKKFDGLILPKGSAASKSGGSITMSRPLAELVFPVPSALPAEDPWIRFITEHLSDVEILSQEVFLNYRIHRGNSHPRHSGFDEFSSSMARRAAAWDALLNESRLPFDQAARDDLRVHVQLERLRSEGRLWSILTLRDAPLMDRLAAMSMANRWLFAIRMRFYRLLTGLRGA